MTRYWTAHSDLDWYGEGAEWTECCKCGQRSAFDRSWLRLENGCVVWLCEDCASAEDEP